MASSRLLCHHPVLAGHLVSAAPGQDLTSYTFWRRWGHVPPRWPHTWLPTTAGKPAAIVQPAAVVLVGRSPRGIVGSGPKLNDHPNPFSTVSLVPSLFSVEMYGGITARGGSRQMKQRQHWQGWKHNRKALSGCTSAPRFDHSCTLHLLSKATTTRAHPSPVGAEAGRDVPTADTAPSADPSAGRQELPPHNLGKSKQRPEGEKTGFLLPLLYPQQGACRHSLKEYEL